MIEDDRALNDYQDLEPPGAEELASAQDVVLSMIRTVKGLRIYLANNPVLIKFVEELGSKLSAHMAAYGDFRLEVARFTLGYKGSYVYENPDLKDNVAFRLSADGISALAFSNGLELQELTDFLEIIGFERPIYQDDDIVTQLWEKGLPHINYLLDEDLVEADLEEEEPELESQQEAISRLLAAVAQNPPPPVQQIPKRLLALTAEEADWLRKAKQAEAQRNPLDDAITILSAILAGVKDPAVFQDFAEIVGTLTVNMFLSGELRHALRLVRFLDKLLKVGGLAPRSRELVKKALAEVLSERAVEVLQEAIDTGEMLSHEDLRELLQILGLPSLGGICELLGRVEKLKMRKVIIEVLVELGQDDPEVFAPFLSDPRWYLVRNVVLVLSMIETPVALEMIVGLISHKEARIRKEVLGFLERSSDPKAKAYILKFFRDESSALRIKALQILARERLSFALKPAVALTAAQDFKSKDLAEKKVVYETIGELGSESMVPLFRDLLPKKRKLWFGQAVDKDALVCAVAGLAKMRNAAALELLEEARAQQTGEIRGIIEQAIAARGRASAGPEGA